jgi:hypothetical protein
MNIEDLLTPDDVQSEAVIWVDHRETEDWIVDQVAEAVAPAHRLEQEFRGDDIYVTYDGAEYRIPLTLSRHDRYVAISSLAAILQRDYDFWLEKDSLGGDTHGFVVLEKNRLDAEEPGVKQAFLEKFAPLELGMDYFSGIAVPYTGNEQHNPDFDKQAREYQEGSDALIKALTESPEFQDAMRGFQADFGKLKRWAIFKYVLSHVGKFALYFIAVFLVVSVVRRLLS